MSEREQKISRRTFLTAGATCIAGAIAVDGARNFKASIQKRYNQKELAKKQLVGEGTLFPTKEEIRPVLKEIRKKEGTHDAQHAVGGFEMVLGGVAAFGFGSSLREMLRKK